ncbi:MAG: hypothetical protein VB092_01655 [Oscillospiraceae bacterium]|nr:hypothetical protein [Oscillospiraceae bacterium]
MKGQIRPVRGHYEVTDLSGRFLFSADTYAEAQAELEQLAA